MNKLFGVGASLAVVFATSHALLAAAAGGVVKEKERKFNPTSLGAIGWPREMRMSRTVVRSVMKAIIRIAPPHLEQRSGNTS